MDRLPLRRRIPALRRYLSPASLLYLFCFTTCSLVFGYFLNSLFRNYLTLPPNKIKKSLFFKRLLFKEIFFRFSDPLIHI